MAGGHVCVCIRILLLLHAQAQAQLSTSPGLSSASARSVTATPIVLRGCEPITIFRLGASQLRVTTNIWRAPQPSLKGTVTT